MSKFNRIYLLTVDTLSKDTLEFKLPITIEFDITRNILTSANVCSVRLFNLSENHRAELRKDAWQYQDLRKLKLQAGYDKNLSTIFEGNVSQCFSVRESTDYITSIECFDGGYAFNNGITLNSFASGTSNQEMIGALLKNLPGVSPGAVGDFQGTIKRANTFNGMTSDIINQITDGAFYIDNSKSFCLKDNECTEDPVFLINSKSGLLGTPLREQTYINFDIIFEPQLSIAQRVKLESQTLKDFNGIHKVVSLKHRGTISESVSGNAITSVGVFAPDTLNVIPYI